MKRELAIFASDQVNRHRIRIATSALMEAEEKARRAVRDHGIPLGRPVHIQHDMHRLIGWSRLLGHLIDGAMVRAAGLISQVETDVEKAELDKVAADRATRPSTA